MKKPKLKWLLSAIVAAAFLPAVGRIPAQAFTNAEDPNPVAQTNAPPQASLDAQSVAETNTTAGVENSRTAGKSGKGPQDIVIFGRTVELKAGETANDLVVIGGSAIVHGKVEGDTVAILGSVTVDGEVNGNAVAVLGNVRLGTNSSVGGETVAVGGNVRLSPGAKIHGNAVAVGGTVERAEGDNVGGDVVGLGGLTFLGDWLEQCVFKLRPLAPQMMWIWVVAGAFCLTYFLVALVFHKPVQVCVNELTMRPATTFLVGLLVKLLVPVVVLILAITGVGLLVIPVLFAALFFGAIIGKVALIEYLGGAIGRPFGFELLKKPLVAFLLGIVLITLLYLVPILGFVTYAIVGLWGLGVAITALFSGIGRERRQRQPPQFPANPAPPGAPSAMNATVPPTPNSEGAGGSVPPAAFTTAPLFQPPRQPNLSVMLTYPRAGFWERMGAAFLDIALLCIPAVMVGHFVLPVALAYFAGMWTWKGTTIGGIVLKLQVVRCDGGPITFPVALVRGLAAAFSAFVLLLGFFWIGWDRDKQGWHDKIAGTVVVRLPHSMPLVCL
jgi:uncharacterized RDD family membrane protein YckC